MDEAELKAIEAAATDTEHPGPIRCLHGREPADRCDTCTGDNVVALVAEVRRLRGLVKAAGERVDGAGNECPWCECIRGTGHFPDCPAFTEGGALR